MRAARRRVTGPAPDPAARDADERLAIKAHTEANGGAYHAELTKSKCTHLIASSAQSEKYQYALRWGTVKIVSLAWFEQCLHTQGAPPQRGSLCPTPAALTGALPPRPQCAWTRRGSRWLSRMPLASACACACQVRRSGRRRGTWRAEARGTQVHSRR